MHHLRRRRGYSHSCRIRQSRRGEAAGIKRSGLYGPLATDRWRDGNNGAPGEQMAQTGAVNRTEKLRLFRLRIQIGKAKELGRAHGRTTITNAHLIRPLLYAKKKTQ